MLLKSQTGDLEILGERADGSTYPGFFDTNKLCPVCGAPAVLSIEPNCTLGLGLTCSVNGRDPEHWQGFIGYEQVMNFREFAKDRIVAGPDLDTDHTQISMETDFGATYAYLVTPEGLWRVWGTGAPYRFQEIPMPPAQSQNPLKLVVKTKFSRHVSWGSEFEGYFDSCPGPYWTLNSRLPDEDWGQVKYLFDLAEEGEKHCWFTRYPREVAIRMLDRGKWKPTSEELEESGIALAREIAIKDHCRALAELKAAWINKKQLEFELWKERNLKGLKALSAPTKICADETVLWVSSWPEGLRGTWYTTGNVYYGVKHPRIGQYVRLYYGNATIVYIDPSQADALLAEEIQARGGIYPPAAREWLKKYAGCVDSDVQTYAAKF